MSQKFPPGVTAEQYLQEFPSVLKLLYLTVNSLRGAALPDPRWIDCERLSAKVFLHAATVKHLLRGTRIDVDESKPDGYATDLSSIIVITRAAIATYLNLFEVFFEPTTDDLFEYRHAVFQINGFKLRETYIPYRPDALVEKRLKENDEALENMRERVRRTKAFSELKPGQQNSSLSGVIYPRRSLIDIAVSAGFLKSLIEQEFAYFSAFIHGDALSVAQVGIATSTERRQLTFPAQILLMMVMSKLILHYYNAFEQARVICDKHQDTMFTVIVTNDLSENFGSFGD